MFFCIMIYDLKSIFWFMIGVEMGGGIKIVIFIY